LIIGFSVHNLFHAELQAQNEAKPDMGERMVFGPSKDWAQAWI